MAFPKHHWRQLPSTNPLERLNGETKRRTDVVAIFPNEDARRGPRSSCGRRDFVVACAAGPVTTA
jgi:hypothetical protein